MYFSNGHLWLQGSLDAMVHLRWLKRHLTSRFSSDAPPMTPKMQGPHKSAVGWKSKLLCLSPWPSRTQQAALLGSPTTAFPGPVSKIPANDRLPRTKHRKDVPFAAGIYATCVCKTKRKRKKNKRNRHQYLSTHSAPRAGAARGEGSPSRIVCGHGMICAARWQLAQRCCYKGRAQARRVERVGESRRFPQARNSLCLVSGIDWFPFGVRILESHWAGHRWKWAESPQSVGSP